MYSRGRRLLLMLWAETTSFCSRQPVQTPKTFTLLQNISGSYACNHLKIHHFSPNTYVLVTHFSAQHIRFSVSLCAKVDWCALNVEHLLTGPEIFRSQLERRALISSWSIFVACVSWEVEMWHVFFYSISTVFRKNCNAVRCLFSPQSPPPPPTLRHCPRHNWATANNNTVIQRLEDGLRRVAGASVLNQCMKL